jgi:hypothetical protein
VWYCGWGGEEKTCREDSHSFLLFFVPKTGFKIHLENSSHKFITLFFRVFFNFQKKCEEKELTTV